MEKSIKDTLTYLASAQGKRVVKVYLIIGVVIAASVVGFYIYVRHFDKLADQKYVLAQNLYLQAAEKEEKEKIEDLRKAAVLFEEIINQRFWSGSKEEVLFYRADCLYRLGSYEESIQTLKEFERKYPHSYFASWVRLKTALVYEEVQDYHQAIQSYEIIEEKYAQTSVAPEALLGQARCQELLENQEEAIKIYQNLISRYPLSSQAGVAQGRLQYLSWEKG